MSSELIINCRVACRWLRMRDNVLCLLSGILWIAMILTLYRMEFKGLASLTYVGVVAAIGGAFFIWSRFRKAVSRYSKKRLDRRSHSTRLAAATVAGYFGMEEEYLCAMQQEKYTSIQYLQDGYVAAVSSPSRPKIPALVSKRFNARLRAAA